MWVFSFYVFLWWCWLEGFGGVAFLFFFDRWWCNWCCISVMVFCIISLYESIRLTLIISMTSDSAFGRFDWISSRWKPVCTEIKFS